MDKLKKFKGIFDAYMQRSKEELAALLSLIEITEQEETIVTYDDTKLKESIDRDLQELEPSIFKDYPAPCRTWADCSNPQMDCIDCPVRGRYGSYGTYTATYTSPFEGQKEKNEEERAIKRDEFDFSC